MVEVLQFTFNIPPFEIGRINGGTALMLPGFGMEAYIQFLIADVTNGTIFIDQVSPCHELIICRDTGERLMYQLPYTHYDSFRPEEQHFMTVNIRDNAIVGANENGVLFSDRVFHLLEDDWTEFKFAIDFEVWIQCQEAGNPIFPIASFKWSVSAECERRDGAWVLLNEAHTDENQINESVQRYQVTDPSMDLNGLNYLLHAVREFKIQNNLPVD